MITIFLLVASLCQPVPRNHAVLRRFQKLHPCPSTGLTYGECPGYVMDHIKPLCLTGKAGDVEENIQWQTVKDAKAKDRKEKADCRKAGCQHRGD